MISNKCGYLTYIPHIVLRYGKPLGKLPASFPNSKCLWVEEVKACKSEKHLL